MPSMGSSDARAQPGPPPRAGFATTHWSLVLSAGRPDDPAAQQALSELCQTYWYPLYAYVRRRVPNVQDAQDLTQAFFSYLLEKRTIARADRTRGRFRAFLLTALKHFLLNEWERARAEKRGGGSPTLSLDFASGESRYQIEPADEVTPETLYERRWVLTLLDLVLARLRGELKDAGEGHPLRAAQAGPHRGSHRGGIRACGRDAGGDGRGRQAGRLPPTEALSSAVSRGGAPHRGRRGRGGRRDSTDPGCPGWIIRRRCYRTLAIR